MTKIAVADGLDIHLQPDPSVTGILTMIETAASGGRIEDRLNQMCAEVARIAGMDVVSVYALEAQGGGEPLLVMRGNVGFPPGNVGRVRLRVGEGLTGMVAECMRSASVAIGYDEARFKEVAGLPEREFPAFVAIPLRAGPKVCGVLVLQSRIARQLSDAEVTLATALSAPFAFALEAKRVAAERAPRGPTGINASIGLPGVTVAPGVAMGRAALVASLDMTLSSPPRDAETRIAAAFSRLRRDLGRTARRLGPAVDPVLRGRLGHIELILTDSRMESAIRAETTQVGITAACYRVAQRYANAPYRTDAEAPSDWLIERSREREAVCVLLRGAALEDEPLQRGVTLVAGRLTGVMTLAAISRGVTGIAIEGRVGHDSLSASLCRAAGVPLLASVAGLLSAVAPGDRIIVDCHSQRARVRPTATEIARIRNSR